MDPLQTALDMLDKACALISELTAQVQSKQSEKDMTKKAESLASKGNLSFDAALDMIKQAEANNDPADMLIKAAEQFNRFKPFGKVASDNSDLTKTGSTAMDKYKEREAELADSLGL